MTERDAEVRARPGAGMALGARRSRTGPSALEIAGIVAGLVWIVLATAIYVFGRTSAAPLGPAGVLTVLTMAVVPVAMIWVAVRTLATARELRAEAARLQGAIDAMRQTYVAQVQGGARPLRPPAGDPGQVPTFASRRETRRAAAPAEPEAQPSLALGTSPEGPPLAAADLVRALQFPDGPDDEAAFRALRLALADRDTAKLVRAAQDVLTLLGQDGIFMDDVVPERARPETWRRFARGERGRAVAGLGGVRDRSSLALTAERMRGDTVFRDAAHHFLRQFDHRFAAFEPAASDAEVAAFADTRTARAFMLLGRAAGTFDGG